MAIRAQFQSRKFFTQTRNGEDLSLNQSEFTNNLRANPLEKIKFLGEVIIYQVIQLSDYFINFAGAGGYGDPTFVVGPINDDFTIQSESSDFSKLSVGDEIKVVWQAGNELNGTITSVDKDLIFCTNVSGSPLIDADQNLNNGLTHGGVDYLVVTNTINYLKYKWGFSDQSGEKNTASRLDGRTNSFELPNIGAAFQDATKALKNANDDTLRIRRLSNAPIPENKYLNTKLLAQRFEIEHIFTVDDYSEDDISAIENGIIPDRYLGDITENYFAALEFRVIESAPETAKLFEYQDDSDIGYFSEKFNEGKNDFTVSDVVITRLSNGDPMEEISSTEPSKVSLRVSSDIDVFGGSINYNVVHKTLLTADNYEFKDENYVDLFDFDSVYTFDTVLANGVVLKNVQASGISPVEAVIEFEVHVGKNYDDTKYLTALIISDPRELNVSRKTVTIPIKTGIYQNDFDIEGLLDNVSIELFQRNCDPYTESGFSSFPVIQGDFIYTRLEFEVLGGLIESIELQTINSDLDEVETLTIDVSEIVEISGEQEINTVLPTPYSHGLDGIVRKVSSGVYEVIHAYRVPFEKLNGVSGLSDVLFDQTEPNQGFNESVFYQQSKGLGVHVAFKIGMFAENRLTYYRYRTPNLTVIDFETNLG